MQQGKQLQYPWCLSWCLFLWRCSTPVSNRL